MFTNKMGRQRSDAEGSREEGERPMGVQSCHNRRAKAATLDEYFEESFNFLLCSFEPRMFDEEERGRGARVNSWPLTPGITLSRD